jgi:hypothetical protein
MRRCSASRRRTRNLPRTESARTPTHPRAKMQDCTDSRLGSWDQHPNTGSARSPGRPRARTLDCNAGRRRSCRGSWCIAGWEERTPSTRNRGTSSFGGHRSRRHRHTRRRCTAAAGRLAYRTGPMGRSSRARRTPVRGIGRRPGNPTRSGSRRTRTPWIPGRLGKHRLRRRRLRRSCRPKRPTLPRRRRRRSRRSCRAKRPTLPRRCRQHRPRPHRCRPHSRRCRRRSRSHCKLPPSRQKPPAHIESASCHGKEHEACLRGDQRKRAFTNTCVCHCATWYDAFHGTRTGLAIAYWTGRAQRCPVDSLLALFVTADTGHVAHGRARNRRVVLCDLGSRRTFAVRLRCAFFLQCGAGSPFRSW